jgi:hypothetical protein
MMPQRIDVTIFWTDQYDSMSFYTMYRKEIEEMIYNYEINKQAHLFTYVCERTLWWWIWDMHCREPASIIVDTIKF